MDEKTFTQEELNQIVGDRLGKEKDKMASLTSEWEEKAKGYESQIATLNSRIEELNTSNKAFQDNITEMTAKLKAYDTQSVKMRVASEFGIPNELASRIAGDNEEEMRKDAEAMKKILDMTKGSQPLRTTEFSEPKSSAEAGLKKLAEQLSSKK